MVTINNKNVPPGMELVGQVLRIKKSTGSHHTADLYKLKTIDQDTKKEVLTYSLISSNGCHFTTGDSIAEVLSDFMWQCDDTDCQPFVELKIFNAHLAEIHQQEISN